MLYDSHAETLKARQFDANHVHTTDDLERHAHRCGSHFFDKDTMHFFMSKVYEPIVRIYKDTNKADVDGFLYITSERNGWNNPREYTIRVSSFDFERTVDLAPGLEPHETGTFGYFSTLQAARRFFDKLRKSWKRERLA